MDCRPPTVEVRCQNVQVEADVFADQSRNLPSIINAYRDVVEVIYAFLGIFCFAIMSGGVVDLKRFTSMQVFPFPQMLSVRMLQIRFGVLLQRGLLCGVVKSISSHCKLPF